MLDKSIQYAAKFTLLTFVFCETLLISATAKPFTPHQNGHKDKKWVIVIDAGHGGKDPGCHGLNYKEKDVALAVSLKLGHLIEENDPNVKVIYTRKTDVFIPLNERADIANRNHADFFICIHCNASPDKTKYGAATYVMGLYKSEGNLEVSKRENASILYEKNYKQTYSGFDPNSDEANILFDMYQNAYLAQSLDLSAKIQKEYAGDGRTDNGVKQAGFLVLWKTTMPSLLTEIGFLTNANEELYLGSQKGQNKIAQSLFFALQQYIDEKEGVSFHASDFKTTPAPIDSTAVHDTIIPASPDSITKPAPIKNTGKIKALVQGLHADSSSVKTLSQKPDSVVAKPVHAKTDSTMHAVIKKVSDSTKIIYKIQIAISPKPLSMDAPQFKNLPDVGYYVDKGTYKYTSGLFTSLNNAVKLEEKLRAQGFKDAFVVAFKGTTRVPVIKGK